MSVITCSNVKNSKSMSSGVRLSDKSAGVIELYLVGSEVPYIKDVCLSCTKLGHTFEVCLSVHASVCVAGEKEKQTDRCGYSLSA